MGLRKRNECQLPGNTIAPSKRRPEGALPPILINEEKGSISGVVARILPVRYPRHFRRERRRGLTAAFEVRSHQAVQFYALTPTNKIRFDRYDSGYPARGWKCCVWAGIDFPAVFIFTFIDESSASAIVEWAAFPSCVLYVSSDRARMLDVRCACLRRSATVAALHNITNPLTRMKASSNSGCPNSLRAIWTDTLNNVRSENTNREFRPNNDKKRSTAWNRFVTYAYNGAAYTIRSRKLTTLIGPLSCLETR